MFYKEVPRIVVDNGSSSTRAGFAGSDKVRSVFPTVVGVNTENTGAKQYVGDEAQNQKDTLDLKFPIQRGTITDWSDMEKIWHHIFYNELHVDPNDYAVLLAEPPLNRIENREQTAIIMFETFNVSALYMANSAVLALYANGRTNGIVFESGDGISNSVPVYEGSAVAHASTPVDLCGHNLTVLMSEFLSKRGYSSLSTSTEIIRNIKERLCYVAFDFEQEMTEAKCSTRFESYELPDGQHIQIGEERFKFCETLFKPNLINTRSNTSGIHQILFDSIMKCDGDIIRKQMFENVICSGGNTLFPGLAKRLNAEIQSLTTSTNVKVNVVAPPERVKSVWLGGSIFASLPTFEKLTVTKAEYDDMGPSIMRKIV